jgi:hypothetical protein
MTFYYTDSNRYYRTVITPGNPARTPEQINDYVFEPTKFAEAAYPSTFPFSKRDNWSPQSIQDLLCAIGPAGTECVGDTCYTTTICEDESCKHTFAQWKEATKGWEEYFELRMTDRRGLGVYTKKAFKEEDMLGWYAGDVLPRSTAADTGYNLEADIGIVTRSDSEPDPVEAVLIDANRKGNWTRFINHSCRPSCTFGMARAGDVRVEVVRACEDIPADVELTIGYGSK